MISIGPFQAQSFHDCGKYCLGIVSLMFFPPQTTLVITCVPPLDSANSFLQLHQLSLIDPVGIWLLMWSSFLWSRIWWLWAKCIGESGQLIGYQGLEGTPDPKPFFSQVAWGLVLQVWTSLRMKVQQADTLRGVLVCISFYSHLTGSDHFALITTSLRRAILVSICLCMELSEQPPCPWPSAPPALGPPIPPLLSRDHCTGSCLWVLLPLSRAPRHLGRPSHCLWKDTANYSPTY